MSLLYKIGIAIVMMIASLTANAQSRSYRIYDAYGNEDGFTSFAFSKTMLDAINLDLDDENKKVTGDFHEMRILIFNPEKGHLKSNFENEISKRLDGMNYKKVEQTDENDDDSEIWIEGNGKKVKECHILVQSKEKNGYGCLVSFYGNFNVDDMDKLEKYSRKQID